MVCLKEGCKMRTGAHEYCVHHRPDDCFPECSICLKAIKRTKETLDCNHCFHKRCIDFWAVRSNTCPVCRAPAYVEEEPEGPAEFLATQFARAFRDINRGATEVTIEFRLSTATGNSGPIRLVNTGPQGDEGWLNASGNFHGA